MIKCTIVDKTLSGCRIDALAPGYGLWTAGQRLDIGSCYSPFVWKISQSTQAEMRYANWCSGQPNFWRGQESCAHIYAWSDDDDDTDRVNCLNDIYCGTEMCAICEIDLWPLNFELSVARWKVIGGSVVVANFMSICHVILNSVRPLLNTL